MTTALIIMAIVVIASLALGFYAFKMLFSNVKEFEDTISPETLHILGKELQRQFRRTEERDRDKKVYLVDVTMDFDPIEVEISEFGNTYFVNNVLATNEAGQKRDLHGILAQPLEKYLTD